MEKTIYIYALIDPFTNEVRYVGKSNDVNRRYEEHLKVKGVNRHKDSWISKLGRQYKKPLVKILEETNENNWSEREKFWISQYDNLINLTEGGEDGSHNDETKEKLREINLGENNPMFGRKWTEEQKMRLSEIRKNRKLTDEWKENLSKSLGHKCIIDGVEYRSIVHAQTELGVGYRKIKSLLKLEGK